MMIIIIYGVSVDDDNGDIDKIGNKDDNDDCENCDNKVDDICSDNSNMCR